TVIFWTREWTRGEDPGANKLLPHEERARYRHYLEQKRIWRPHYLSEPEEKVLEEKSNTGRSAFVRLFDETVSSIQCPYKRGRESASLSVQQVLAKLYDPDRKARAAGAAALTKGLQANA